MKATIHAFAGALAMTLILAFQISTLVSELFLDAAAVLQVKTAIVYALAALVLLMAATGASGFSLSKGRVGPLIEKKKTRMKLIAANGVLIMLPSAAFLYMRASAGQFDWLFYTVQTIEIAFGLLQLTLLSLNFRDGRAMTATKRRIARARASGSK